VNAKLTVSAELHQIVVPPPAFVNAVLPFWIQDSPDTSLTTAGVFHNTFFDTFANVLKSDSPLPLAATITSLAINLSTSSLPSGGQSVTFTLYKNDVATALAVTFTAGQSAQIAAGSVGVSSDDRLAIVASFGGGMTSTFVRGGCLGMKVAP
jgi:hypothetical protein